MNIADVKGAMVATRLPQALNLGLERVVKMTGRTKANILRDIVETYLEDYADYEIALKRFNDPNDEVLTMKEAGDFLREKHGWKI